MERGIPAILVYEDLTNLCPHMHAVDDVVGIGLNDDALFHANARTALGTIFTLARPIAPDPIVLHVTRELGDPRDTARLSWTGGFPAWDVHRDTVAEGLRDDTRVHAPELTDPALVDDAATGRLVFYAVEEFP